MSRPVSFCPSGKSRSATEKWRDRAACRGVPIEVFYPGTGDPETLYDEARSYCDSCPVQAECLDYALATNQEFGMWAGHTDKDLRRIRKRRKAAARGRTIPEEGVG